MTTVLTPRGAAIKPFYAGEIGLRAMTRRRAGLPMIPMHFGQPSAGIPAKARAAAHASLDHHSSGYWLSAALRERFACHYAETHGVDVAADRVLLTSGASAGLVAVFAALFAQGDRIGLARPSYPAIATRSRRSRPTPFGRARSMVDRSGGPIVRCRA